VSHAIWVEDLFVRYRSDGPNVLNGLNLQVERGSFFGLLGPNGAGKTTLISFLCGQVEGTYRAARVLGVERSTIALFKRKLGYAPQEIALYPTLSARENLVFFARLLDMRLTEVDRVLEWIGLSERAAEPVSDLSGGMKRRLNLGVALLNRPELLILDEPTVGVDPQSRGFIFERILELRRQGVTVIYSTHYLEEVKRLCDHVGVIAQGRMLVSGPLEDVLGHEDLERRYLEITGREVE
jgi:ABC-2 type transport system ATP-binding protein